MRAPLRRRSALRDERGAVMVLVAVTLPVLILFVAFGIEIGHWFDYSRNLQNRADAAALAAGVAYGGTCFGNYTTAQTDVIGQVAQQYSGPPAGTPSGNLPFPSYAGPYQNQPNLTKGTPANYHVLLNSTQYWNQGGTDWGMGDGTAKGTSLALCNSKDEDGNVGPMADVRVTQANIGLFFPLFGFTPTISAHARVTLEGVGSENNVVPLAVRDPAEERCVEANFYNDSTGAQIGSPVPLKKIGTDPNTGAVQWDNAAAPASVGIPSGANVYVQIETGYCDQNPATYDSSSGLLYINSWSTASLPLPAGARPVVTNGGVFLSGSCNSDKLSNMYFTDQNCAEGLTANVAFAPGAGTTTVSATDTNTNTTIQLSNTGGNTWSTPAGKSFAINASSGQHLFDITTSQSTGNPCGGKGNKVGVCDLGNQAQAFGACDDGNPNLTCNNPPNDSGPILLSQLRLSSDSAGTWASDPTQTYGENAFVGGSTQQMVVTTEIAGLSNAKPGDPPTILRFSENGPNIDHATGLIDCGEGQGNPGNISALINGCPTAGSPACPVGSNGFNSCAPLAINKRPVSDATPCDPEGNDLSGTIVARTTTNIVPVDCTGTAAGNSPPVINGLACRVILAGCQLNNGKANGSVCSPNNWSPTEGASSIQGGDPRALTMVITAPSDLAKNNSGQIIPIENFAVFYVTGWTTQQNDAPGCGSYAAAPPGTAMDAEHLNNCPNGSVPPNGQCAGTSKGMVWGFWIKYTDPNANPIGTICNPSAFGNCTPALTR